MHRNLSSRSTRHPSRSKSPRLNHKPSLNRTTLGSLVSSRLGRSSAMGCYIDAEAIAPQTLEAWLAEHGKPLNVSSLFLCELNSTELPVVLVENFMFQAAAIAYDKTEIARFTRHDDVRPTRWFLVPRAELIKVSELNKI
jgi:hypothetical protein